MPVLHLHLSPRLQPAAGIEVPLSARESALLAWLHLQGPTPRARLAGLLWPAGSESQARANLRQTLARLKRAAGPVLDETDGLLRLAADVAVAPPPEAAAPLLGALAFDDAPEYAEWLAARRDDALRRHQRETLAAARAALERGELDAALAAADAVLATHPETEEAWRLRMEAFHRRGDRAAALQAWDDCRHALRSAFGVAPAAETQALGRQLLQDAPAPPTAAPPASPAALPPALRRPPQLLGRDALLAALRAGLALGQGAVVLGPGGIGKSRLLAELALHAGPALAVGARPGDAPRTGALVMRLVEQALRRFEPELDAATRADLGRLLPPAPGVAPPADLRSALEHRRVLGAVTRLLQACHGRGMRVVIVDDLQFADEASLEVLQVLVGAWRDTPPEDCAPPLLAARGDELGATGRALLDLLAGSGRAARHELAPLHTAEVRQLLDAVLPAATPAAPDGPSSAAPPIDRDALAEALQAQVGGNPAFLIESLKGLWQCGLLFAPTAAPGASGWRPGQPLPVPPTLLEAVRLRLQRLGPEALQLAQLAAVAQADFSLALAAGACGRPALQLAPVLAELSSAQVFDGQAFAHDLVAEAVRATLPPALEAALHRLVAEQLMARAQPAGAPAADPPGLPASIAAHLDAAGERRGAAAWHLRAAMQARARWQMPAAATAFEAAASRMDPQAEREAACDAWRQAARCWHFVWRYDACGRALEQAAALARSEREHALVLATRTTWLFNTDHYREAADNGLALAALLARGDFSLGSEDLQQVLLTCALTAPYGEDAAPLLGLFDQMQARADTAPATTARIALARGLVLNWLARPLEARAQFQQGWQIATANELRGECVNLGNQWMRSEELLGLPAAALQAGERTRQAIADAGAGVGYELELTSHQVLLHLALGRPDRALAGLAASPPSTGARASPYDHCRALMAALVLGRPERAARALAALDALAAEAGPPAALSPLAAYLRWARARAQRAAGAPSAAVAAALAAPASRAAEGLIVMRHRVMQARFADPADPAAVDRAALADLAAELQARGLRGLLRVLQGVLARAALAAGEAAAAAGHARAALALAAHADVWADQPAAVWLDAAEVLQACGQADEAAAARAAGLAWVEAAAATLADADDRRAWREGNAVHRALRHPRTGPGGEALA